jgi:C1A family cysteine protease
MLRILISLISLVAVSSSFERFKLWMTEFDIKLNESHIHEMFVKWTDNDNIINVSNAQGLPYALGHNHFSGMDRNDFREYLNSEYQIKISRNFKSPINDFLPESINWVENGAVTDVKDQKQCGSCWSFSATGALEGAYYIKYDALESFSEQQLVDCDNWKRGGKDHGCNGGLMDNAFSWISKNGGICSEYSYPYTGADNECKSCAIVPNSKIINWVDVIPSSDSAMMAALSLQPVSIAIEADQPEFQLYKSGVYTAKCGTKLDHGVLAVGYGSFNGLDYYMVKNSWSKSWGSDGYILLGRGGYNGVDGQCGMLLQASYPLL